MPKSRVPDNIDVGTNRTDNATAGRGNTPKLRMSAFFVDPRIHIVQHPMKHAEMDALDHPHVSEIDEQAVLLHRLELAPRVASEPIGDEAVSVGPIDGIQHVGAVAAAADRDEQVAL